MGYIFLTIALFAGATKGYMGKKVSGLIVTPRQSYFVNMIRMAICVVISTAILAIQSGINGIVIDKPALIYGLMAGITLSTFTVTWLLAVKYGAYMLISVAQTFGMVVTLVCSLAVFREPISTKQMIGIVILIAAVLIMASYSSILKGKLSLRAIILLVLCGLSNGLHDFSQKLFTSFSASEVSTLNLLTYAISAAVLGVLFLIPSKTDKFDAKGLLKTTLVSMLIMSVCLFLNSYLMALSTKHLTATQLYPVSRAGGMIIAALMSRICFKEKITVRCIIGLVLSFIAIMLLK